MAGIVVFVTTYSLILPAISIEYNIAQSMPGLDVPDNRQAEDMSVTGELSTLQYDDSGELLSEGSDELYQDPDYGTGELELTGGSTYEGIDGCTEVEDYKNIDGYGDDEDYRSEGGYGSGEAYGTNGDSESYVGLEGYLSAAGGIDTESYTDSDGLYIENEGLVDEETSEGIISTADPVLPEASTDSSYASHETDYANGAENAGSEVLADVNSLTAELEGVKLRLDFDEVMPGDSELLVREIEEEYYDNYFTSAGYELEKVYPDYEMSDAEFYCVEIPYGRTAVRAEFEFDPAISEYQAGENKVLVMDWCDGEWHLYDAEKTELFRHDDGAVYRISFETDALYKGNAGFGVITLYPAGDGELETDSSVGNETAADSTFDGKSAEETSEDSVADEEENKEEESEAEDVLPETEEEGTAYKEEHSDVTAETENENPETETEENDTESVVDEETEGDEPESAAEEEPQVDAAEPVSEEEPQEEEAEAAEEVEYEDSGFSEDVEMSEEESEVIPDKEAAVSTENPEDEEETLYETFDGVSGSHTVTVPGADYKLHVTYGEGAGIPADAVFTAIPVSDGEYGSQAVEMVADKADKEGSVSLIGLVDLVVSVNGNVIAPTGPMEVSVEFPEEIPDNEKIYAVHFPGTGEQPSDDEDRAEHEYNDATMQEEPDHGEELILDDNCGDTEADFTALDDNNGDTEADITALDDNSAASGAAGTVLDANIEAPEVDSAAPEFASAAAEAAVLEETALEPGLAANEADTFDELIDITDIYTDLVPSEPAASSENMADAVLLTDISDENAPDPVLSENGGSLEETLPEVLETDTDGAEASFTVNSLSYIAIVSYTVDFHWEVDGRMYEFSLPGGGFISFSELIEVLGVAKTGENDDVHLAGEVPGIDNQDVNGEKDTSENTESAENTGYSGVHNPMEVSGIDNQDATALTLDGVEVSEATREFVADVESVVFSNPALVDVSKVENETTVGGIKESRGLEVQYSAELTEEQIAEINSTVVESGDWVLISVQPFESTESLTVTMKTGEVFEIRVTDAQIQKDFIDAKGDTWTITVIYDDSAEIPDGADLNVREIEAGTEEYQDYLNDSAEELGVASEEVSFARFFDIEIVDNDGRKVEPKAPVQVKIGYKSGIDLTTGLSIVHFGDEKTEVITDLGVSQDGTEIIYEQDSFSVTGTIQTGAPSNEGLYMLLVKRGDNYYLINNDGELTQVEYNSSTGTVTVDTPMLWTYHYEYGGHFRFASEATGFDENMVAAGYYYRYLDPNVSSGLTEENSSNPNLNSQTVINYYNHQVANSGFNNYIGVVDEGNGNLRIGGLASSSEAAEIILASVNSVPSTGYPDGPINHTVNHIDISIEGTTTIEAPLAYGEYYFDANQSEHAATVSAAQPMTLEITQTVGVETADMKRATITATRADTGAVINNAYYITGYSANAATEWSTPQVRIEGSFKVADMSPASWWNSNADYIRAQRLQNKIEYTVSVTKTIEVPLTIDGRQIYDQWGNKMTVTVDVPMSATFNYFDIENECPPLQYSWGYTQEWQSGGIHPWGISGMDFVTNGGEIDLQANVVAVEITKYIRDEDGNAIPVGTNITNKFDIYQSLPGDPYTVAELSNENVDYSDYSKLHTDSLIVPEGSSEALIHDYSTVPGMYYIKEDPSSIPTSIVDTTGNTWNYVSTKMETEYVWRGNTVAQRHTSEVYSDTATEDYTSIPDVLGAYEFEGCTEENYYAANGGNHPYNGFLEFYVYNVYEKANQDEPNNGYMNIQLNKLWDNMGDDTAPSDSDSSVTFQLYQIKKTTTATQGSGGGDVTVELYDKNSQLIDSIAANRGDTLTLTYQFKESSAGYQGTDVQLYASIWNQGWGYKDGAIGPNNGWHIYASAGSNEQSSTFSPYADAADKWGENNVIQNGIIKLRLRDRASNEFLNIAWSGGTAGSSQSTETVVTDDPVAYGSPVTISKSTDWSHLYANLPSYSQTTSGDTTTTIEYSYYLVETGRTGAAASYAEVSYKDNDGSDADHAITANGYTKEVEVTNHKTSILVKKEWRGEAETDAYPEIKFQLYQGWKSGSGVSSGWLYTGDTNNTHDSSYNYTITADDDWQMLFENLPTEASHDGTTGEVGYYVVEVDPDDGSSWFNKVRIEYESSAVSGTQSQPSAAGIGGNMGELTIVNTLPENSQVSFNKTWYESNGTSWNAMSADDTSGYLLGVILQRRAVFLDNSGDPNGNTSGWENYGEEILVSKDAVIKNDNEFGLIYGNSAWNYHTPGTGETGNRLVQNGYYEQNGTQEWVKFEYRFRETSAYDLAAYNNDGTLQTLAWESTVSDNNNVTAISNYPVGEIDVTKEWSGGNEGSKVYIRLSRDGTDITADIVANPMAYGLYPNQVYDDEENDGHDAIVILYDGTSWNTVQIKGLDISDIAHGSTTNYNYTIQEIGYSDKNGNDTWDVSSLLTGYKVGETVKTVSDSDQKSQTVTAGGTVSVITVQNEYVPTVTDFEFTKVWKDVGENITSWCAPITVTLYQEKENGEGGYTAVTNSGQVVIDPFPSVEVEEGEEPERPEIKFTLNGVEYACEVSVDDAGRYYTFTIKDLPYRDASDKNQYRYYVTEETVDGFWDPLYGFMDNDGELHTITNRSKAEDGQYIINNQAGVALPSTGGPGTRLFTILGSILVMIAGVMLWRRRRYI